MFLELFVLFFAAVFVMRLVWICDSERVRLMTDSLWALPLCVSKLFSIAMPILHRSHALPASSSDRKKIEHQIELTLFGLITSSEKTMTDMKCSVYISLMQPWLFFRGLVSARTVVKARTMSSDMSIVDFGSHVKPCFSIASYTKKNKQDFSA